MMISLDVLFFLVFIDLNSSCYIFDMLCDYFLAFRYYRTPVFTLDLLHVSVIWTLLL